jgi:hypothetical protein
MTVQPAGQSRRLHIPLVKVRSGRFRRARIAAGRAEREIDVVKNKTIKVEN